MKKYVAIAILISLFVPTVMAQTSRATFSPALFTAFWRPNATTVAAGGQTAAAVRRPMYQTTVLRFEDGVSDLTDRQKKILDKVVRRLEEGRFSMLKISAAYNPPISQDRMGNVYQYVASNNSSNNSFNVSPANLPIKNVRASDVNAVKIVEIP